MKSHIKRLIDSAPRRKRSCRCGFCEKCKTRKRRRIRERADLVKGWAALALVREALFTLDLETVYRSEINRGNKFRKEEI